MLGIYPDLITNNFIILIIPQLYFFFTFSLVWLVCDATMCYRNTTCNWDADNNNTLSPGIKLAIWAKSGPDTNAVCKPRPPVKI